MPVLSGAAFVAALTAVVGGTRIEDFVDLDSDQDQLALF